MIRAGMDGKIMNDLDFGRASSRRDHLTETTPKGKIELTEEELKRVSGGKVIVRDISLTKYLDKSSCDLVF